MTVKMKQVDPACPGACCPCGHAISRHAFEDDNPGWLYCVPCWGNTDTDNYCRVRL